MVLKSVSIYFILVPEDFEMQITDSMGEVYIFHF